MKNLTKIDKDFIALENKIYKLERNKQKTIAKNYKQTLDSLRTTLARMYSKYEIEGQLTFNEMAKYNRLQRLDKEVFELITKLYIVNSKMIKGTLEGIIKDTYTNSIDIANKHTGGKIKAIVKDINVTKTINNEMAGLKWTERMNYHRSTAIYEVQKEIKFGLTQGDTYRTMSKRLKDKLETDVRKANTIVRTEGHRCLAQAKEDSFDRISKAGIDFKKKWLSSNDERVRTAHQELDGVVINKDDMFRSSNGGVGTGPGMMNNASDDILCRCVLTMVIE